MQLIKNKEQIGRGVFFAGVIINLGIMGGAYGEWSFPLRGRFLQASFVLFCIKILLTYYTKTEWLVMILLGIIGGVSYLCSGDEYVLSVVVMIFAAKKTDMRRVCKWIFGMALLASVITAILSIIGIGGILVDIRDYGRGGVEARWCLGFGHANNVHGTAWYLTVFLIYLFFEKLDWRHYAVLTIGNFILFAFTISKAGFIAMQLVLTAGFLLRYIKMLKQQSWIYFCGVLAFAGVVGISIISVSIEWLKSPILMFLDKVFTGRINLAYQYANISTWKLLSPAGELLVPVDNGWVKIFFDYGYLAGIVFLVFHVYLLWRIYMNRDAVLLIWIVTYFFYTFMEATFTVNSVYMLGNIAYIACMIVMAERKGCENEPKRVKD